MKETFADVLQSAVLTLWFYNITYIETLHETVERITSKEYDRCGGEMNV